MNRTISFLLVLIMAVRLLSGCAGGETTVQTEAPAVTHSTTAPEPTEESTMEPTQSAEERLIASLPERIRQAYELGIVELSLLWDLDRIVTIGEAAAMLQKAYVHRTGVESKMLAELMVREDWSGKKADRGWIANVPGLADLELPFGDDYENYEQWLEYVDDTQKWETLNSFKEQLGLNSNWIDSVENLFITTSYGGMTDICPDRESAVDISDSLVYGSMVYDSVTGEKYFTFDEGNLLNMSREVSVAETVEYALVYYNFLNPMAYPRFAAPEEVGKYNAQIITEDLLNKETDLPSASCAELPANWHGVVMDDLTVLEKNCHAENRIFEYEIRAVKEAGFNYIGLEMDFNWLVDTFLQTPHKYVYNGFVKEEDVGKIDLDRLEHIDQVLAWCMEYDIHLNLRCVGVGGFGDYSKYGDQCNAIANPGKYKAALAEKWGAIARRYADIPNEYLSFTLFTAYEDEYGGPVKVTNELLIPSVEAIRRESPDRCIVANIMNGYQDAEAFAQMGVALSYRLYEPEGVFNFSTSGYFSYQFYRMNLNTSGAYAVKSFTWPYQDRYDGEALLDCSHAKGDTFRRVMELAEEYGVGCMLSEFGVHLHRWGGIALPRFRYADEAYKAMIVDITGTMEEKGYGWCFAHWYSPYGVAFAEPIIENSVYEQVGDHPYYIDKTVEGWFREINGVG